MKNEAIERGNRILDELEANCKDALSVSAGLLMELIRDNEETQFGRTHHLTSLKTREDCLMRTGLLCLMTLTCFTNSFAPCSRSRCA